MKVHDYFFQNNAYRKGCMMIKKRVIHCAMSVMCVCNCALGMENCVKNGAAVKQHSMREQVPLGVEAAWLHMPAACAHDDTMTKRPATIVAALEPFEAVLRREVSCRELSLEAMGQEFVN